MGWDCPPPTHLDQAIGRGGVEMDLPPKSIFFEVFPPMGSFIPRPQPNFSRGPLPRVNFIWEGVPFCVSPNGGAWPWVSCILPPP